VSGGHFTLGTIGDYFEQGLLPEKIVAYNIVRPEGHLLSEAKKKLILERVENYLLKLNFVRNQLKVSIEQGALIHYSEKEISEMSTSTRPYPLVFSATQNLTPNGGGMQGEVAYEGNLKLGREIRVLITNAEYQSRLRRYLRTHHLRGIVYVATDAQFMTLPLLDAPTIETAATAGAAAGSLSAASH